MSISMMKKKNMSEVTDFPKSNGHKQNIQRIIFSVAILIIKIRELSDIFFSNHIVFVSFFSIPFFGFILE